jgi:hypothetical protein
MNALLLKYKYFYTSFFLVIFSVLTSVCQNTNNNVFSLIPPTKTNISFNNILKETVENNIFVYKGFYKGGGVAIGDLNNDGLQDIYFTGNQVGDQLYLNKGNLEFENITKSTGIENKGGWSTHVSMIDINNDGYKDIYVCKSLYDNNIQLRENELYINNGNLTFTESAKAYGLNDNNRSTQANFFDYDRDGDFDLFLINQPKNSSILAPKGTEKKLLPEDNYKLYENNQNHFKIAKDNGGLSNMGYGLSSVIADFNNDGWQDIYVANDYKGPDFFYINNKDGTFTNKIYKNLKHTSYFSMGSDVGDINNDGWFDFVVLDMVAEDNYKLKSNMSSMNPSEFWKNVRDGGHYQYMYNTLQLNNGIDLDGNLQFSEIAQMAGVATTDWSWSPLLADFDNDGLLDLFATNGIKREIGNTDALKKLDGYIKETLDKHNPDKSPNFDIWKHLDLDKILNLFPSDKVKNYMFQNTNGLKFKKVTDDWGFNQKTFSTGAAYGDLDNDGDLDIVVNNIDDIASVYKNNTIDFKKNNYLRIKFNKKSTTQSFIGTKVTLFHQNGEQISLLTNARGINSTSEEIIHFGLGKIKKIDSIKINWFDGKTSILHKIKVNQLLDLDYNELLKKNNIDNNQNIKSSLFEDITENARIDLLHKENVFDDYGREVLLPHRMSTLGSGVAIGDFNGDHLDDFYLGAPIGDSGALMAQQTDGTFKESYISFNPEYFMEDMGSVFFDADNDGDQDLYVVSGGNENKLTSSYYQDRLYINSGNGKFELSKDLLPEINASGSRVKTADYDNDGDLDLFVGGRQVPGRYPQPAQSYILKNNFKETGKVQFTKTNGDVLNNLGMVTDAAWTDFDGDNDLDIILTGIWMPITILENVDNQFINSTEKFNLQNTIGWWYSISKDDLDNDGDEDYVLGNLGTNYKYKANPNEPFSVHYDDFDNSGQNDIVLSYYNYGKQYPLRGRSCSSQQIPEIKNKFQNYDLFASASLTDVYGGSQLTNSLHYEANSFESVSIENLGKGNYSLKPLPDLAQISSINSTVIYDVDKDGIKDLIIAGNLYGSEIETPRNDASIGLYLKGKGDFQFDPIPMSKSGLNLSYDVKEMKIMNYQNGKALVIGVNNGKLRLIKIN